VYPGSRKGGEGGAYLRLEDSKTSKRGREKVTSPSLQRLRGEKGSEQSHRISGGEKPRERKRSQRTEGGEERPRRRRRPTRIQARSLAIRVSSEKAAAAAMESLELLPALHCVVVVVFVVVF
jgi:hypothetical protein